MTLSRTGFKACPINFSFSPKSYKSAVSKKLIPSSKALFIIDSAFARSVPKDIHPKPSSETYKSEEPNGLFCNKTHSPPTLFIPFYWCDVPEKDISYKYVFLGETNDCF